MRIVRVGTVDGEAWDIVADKIDWLASGNEDVWPMQVRTFEVVWHYGFWDKKKVGETRAIEIDCRKLVWARELGRDFMRTRNAVVPREKLAGSPPAG